MNQEPPVQVSGSRVNVLSYPAPATGRYILFVVALVTSGMFVGSWLHNEILGDEWVRRTAECQTAALSAGAGSSPEAVLARTEAIQRCAAPVERVRGLWHIGGALVIAAAAVVVLYLVPPILRRRRKLRPPLPKHGQVAARFAQLATESGLRRSPMMLIGPARMVDAFSFGTPGNYAVALPPKVIGLLQRPGAADGVLRHEFAHIRHRDVELAWLARTVWYVLMPLLLIPAVGSILSGDFSLLPSYLWRAALLVVVVELVTASLLRSREHDADLRAGASASNFTVMLSGLDLAGSVPPTEWVKQLRSRHPGSEGRARILAAPELTARTGFGDAFAAAFLSALALPLVTAAVTPLVTAAGLTLPGQWTGAVLVGPLLALTVGFSQWRSTLMRAAAVQLGQPTGNEPSLLVPALGMAAGLALGTIASLAQTGLSFSGLNNPLWLVVPILFGTGAVAMADSLGRIWAPLARLASRPSQAWLPALAINTVLFTAAIWIWSTLQLSLDQIGWQGTRHWLVAGYEEPPLVASALFLTAAAVAAFGLLGKAAQRPLPKWIYLGAVDPVPGSADLADAGHLKLKTLVSVGAATGLVSTIVLVTWRLLNGPLATTDAILEMAVTVPLICAAAWGACGFGLSFATARIGPAAGLVAGLAAVLVNIAGFLIFNFFRGGTISAGFVSYIMWPAVGAGLVFLVLASSMALIPSGGGVRGSSVKRGRFFTFPLAAAMLAALAVIASHPSPDAPSGPDETGVAAPTASDSPGSEEAELYAEALAPRYVGLYEAIDLQIIEASDLVSSSPAAAADHLRTIVVPLISELNAEARTFVPQSEPIQTLHSGFLAAIELTEDKTVMFADSLANSDEDLYAQASALQEQEAQLLAQWIEGVRLIQSDGLGR